jgi:hypothetical protein
MKGYITYNRVINLMTVYFYHNQWPDQTTDYVKEKYDRTFCCLPDRITIVNDKIIYPKTISTEAIRRFYITLSDYRKKWNYTKRGLKLTTEEVILLFTVSYLSNGYINPKSLQKRYSDLFTSYDFINDHSVLLGLHELLVQVIQSFEKEKEDEFLPYKRASKLVNIKRRIGKV